MVWCISSAATVRKRSLERQNTTVLYDDLTGYDASDSYSYTVASHQTQLESSSKYDNEYGLDSKWNTNFTNYDSHMQSIGKQLPPLPMHSLIHDTMASNNASTFLPSSIPIVSGSSKKIRQLPQPISSMSRRKRASATRQLPQMPTARSRSRNMPRSDTEYLRFGVSDEFERRGAMSAMLYEDYDSTMVTKNLVDYPKSVVDETSSSYGNKFYSNDSLNTTAQSLFSECSASERRQKLASITMATPIASAYAQFDSTQSHVQDPYYKYLSDVDDNATSSYYHGLESNYGYDLHPNSRKRLPQVPNATSKQHIYDTSTDYSLEPSVQRTAKRLPIVAPKQDATMTNCKWICSKNLSL